MFAEMAKTKFAAIVALAEPEANSARKEEAMIGQGEKRRSILTGKVYKVKAIDDWSVILESLDGSSEVCTEWDNLKLFYENSEEGDNLNN